MVRLRSWHACAIGTCILLASAASARPDCAVVITGAVHHLGNSGDLWPSYPLEGTSWSRTFDLPECMRAPFRLELDVYDCELDQGDVGEVRINGVLLFELPDINVEPDPPPQPGESDWVSIAWDLTPEQAALLLPQGNTFWIQGGGNGLDDMLFRNVVLTPEPASLLLLSLAAGSALRRR